MKAAAIVSLLMLVFADVPAASAEFYRYTDRHGNVLYTDDLSKVPKEQREKAQMYEESSSAPLPTDENTPTPPDTQDMQPAADDFENERKSLEQQERNLNKEYDALMKRRSELDEEKNTALTPDQIKDYNQKITEFNAHIQAYDTKRDALTAQVQAFNERLKPKP